MTTRNRPNPIIKWLEERISDRPAGVAVAFSPHMDRLNRILLLAKVVGR